MQRSLASMAGMPIVTRQGVRMGEIRDAWLDPGEHRLLAFDVEWERDRVLERDEPLPLTDLVELTADVATVAEEIGTTLGLDRDFPLGGDGLLRALDHVFDMPVVDGAGQRLGLVADVLFDPQDGSVRFYEVATGESSDSPDEVRMLAPHRALEFRDGDALVVPDEARSAFKPAPAARVDVVMLDELGLEEPQGEDDVEIVRGRPQAEA